MSGRVGSFHSRHARFRVPSVSRTILRFVLRVHRSRLDGARIPGSRVLAGGVHLLRGLGSGNFDVGFT